MRTIWATLLISYVVVCHLAIVGAVTTEVSGKISYEAHFVTEPDYVPTFFKVENTPEPNDESLLAPGYVFMDPVHGGHKIGRGGIPSGPQIREQDGTLVWYGGDSDSYGAQLDHDTASYRRRVQDFHVCDYMGTSGLHLCWSEQASSGHRKKIVVDQSYELVKELITGFHYDAGTEWSNMHEFNMINNGTAYLQPAWPERAADLSEIGGPKEGTIWDGCFQEVDVESGDSTFEWCWMDHFPIWEVDLFPTNAKNISGNITSPKVGSGEAKFAFDAWHLNAIDKNVEGDYLVSVRHDDQILKVAGNDNVHGVEPGTVLWRCGGRGSTVVNEDDFIFTKQHSVRYLETTSEETVFSILDNAWEGALQPSSDASSGMVISVNNRTNTARLLRRYPNPKGAVAPSQGSFQSLPNGNVFIGWGSRSQLSEFSESGQLLFHASYSNDTIENASDTSYSYSYRLTKSPWEGKPTWSPKLITYTQNCTCAVLMAWVSWNGATEVRSWRFHVANDVHGPWFESGTWPRTGYETEANLSEHGVLGAALRSVAFPRFVSVTALDQSGAALPFGEAIVETFVPSHTQSKLCTASGCFEAAGFDYDLRLGRGQTCAQSKSPQLIVLIILVVILEVMDTLYTRIVNGSSKATWQNHRRAPSTMWDHGMPTGKAVYQAFAPPGGLASSSASNIHVELLRPNTYRDSEDLRGTEYGDEHGPANGELVQKFWPRHSGQQKGFAQAWFVRAIAVLSVIIALVVTFRAGIYSTSSTHGIASLSAPNLDYTRPSLSSLPVGTKVVGLVFYGRPQFVDILDCYLRRNLKINGGHLDEIRFILHTPNQGDIDWLSALIERDSLHGVYKLLHEKQDLADVWAGGGDFSYLWGKYCTDDKTIYIKIDDDLIYIHDNAVPYMVNSLLARPDAHSIQANIINSRFTHWQHFSTGAILPFLPETTRPELAESTEEPRDWRLSKLPSYPTDTLPALPDMIFDTVVQPHHDNRKLKWNDDTPYSPPYKNHRWLPLPPTAKNLLYTPFANGTVLPDPKDGYNHPLPRWTQAAQEHYSFLANLEAGSDSLSRYAWGDPKTGLWNTWYQHYNINFLAFWGSTIAKSPFWNNDTDYIKEDETAISMKVPRRLNMPVLVDTRALVAHYAFHSGGQRSGLLLTDLLDRYRLYANEMVCSADNQKQRQSVWEDDDDKGSQEQHAKEQDK